MAQINIYVPDSVARVLRAQAKRNQKSLSQYVVALLQGQTGTTSGWQKDFFTKVVGGWKGELPPMPRPSAEDRPGL